MVVNAVYEHDIGRWVIQTILWKIWWSVCIATDRHLFWAVFVNHFFAHIIRQIVKGQIDHFQVLQKDLSETSCRDSNTKSETAVCKI